MADTDPAQNEASKRTKRRLRQAPTIREKALKENEKLEKKSKQADTGARGVLRAFFRGFAAPLKFIGKFLLRVVRFVSPKYFRNSVKELKLVSWPKFRESLRLVTAVIIFSVIFGIIVAALDYGLSKLFKIILVN